MMYCFDIILKFLEAFATPCSTPVANETSDLSDSRRTSVDETSKNVTNYFDESNFHNKIYERLVYLFLNSSFCKKKKLKTVMFIAYWRYLFNKIL